MNAPTTVRFPDDEGYHKDASDEWWYFNGHLSSEDGKNYGLVVCFFPSSMLSMLVDASIHKVLHRAIVTDLRLEKSGGSLNLRFGPSWWRAIPRGQSSYRMHVEADELQADLTMKSLKPPLLVDGTGNIREGLLGRSYYYAQTCLEVHGTIKLENLEAKVLGKGWIDRQWGKWDWAGLGRWQWFSVQLSNNVEMLALQIFHPLTGAAVMQSFNISDGEGRAEILENFLVKENGRWRSPDTKVQYGVGWTMDSPGRFHLRIMPVTEDQELNVGLWEGDCEVRGSYEGQEVSGRAYVEQMHGRVYGGASKRLFFLMLGVVNHLLRKMSTRIDLVGSLLRRTSRPAA